MLDMGFKEFVQDLLVIMHHLSHLMALVGFNASAVQVLTYQNGDHMGLLKNYVWRVEFYNGFRFVLLTS